MISEDEVFLFTDAYCHPDKVYPCVVGEKVWNDGCLATNYRHSSLFCAFYEPDCDLVDNKPVVRSHGEVVEEADGFGARADQIIRAHRDTIYPDGIILPHHLSNDYLRSDVIGMEAQDPAIVEINETRVMANRENGTPDFSFTGLECRFEASS